MDSTDLATAVTALENLNTSPRTNYLAVVKRMAVESTRVTTKKLSFAFLIATARVTMPIICFHYLDGFAVLRASNRQSTIK